MPTIAAVNPSWLVIGTESATTSLGTRRLQADRRGWLRCTVVLAAEGVGRRGTQVPEMVVTPGQNAALTTSAWVLSVVMNGRPWVPHREISFDQIGQSGSTGRVGYAFGSRNPRLQPGTIRATTKPADQGVGR